MPLLSHTGQWYVAGVCTPQKCCEIHGEFECRVPQACRRKCVSHARMACMLHPYALKTAPRERTWPSICTVVK
eukprot:2357105-Pleurochrysis_carterae.AAC.2